MILLLLFSVASLPDVLTFVVIPHQFHSVLIEYFPSRYLPVQASHEPRD